MDWFLYDRGLLDERVKLAIRSQSSSADLTFLRIILVLRLLLLSSMAEIIVFPFTKSTNADAFIRRKLPYIFI